MANMYPIIAIIFLTPPVLLGMIGALFKKSAVTVDEKGAASPSSGSSEPNGGANTGGPGYDGYDDAGGGDNDAVSDSEGWDDNSDVDDAGPDAYDNGGDEDETDGFGGAAQDDGFESDARDGAGGAGNDGAAGGSAERKRNPLLSVAVLTFFLGLLLTVLIALGFRVMRYSIF